MILRQGTVPTISNAQTANGGPKGNVASPGVYGTVPVSKDWPLFDRTGMLHGISCMIIGGVAVDNPAIVVPSVWPHVAGEAFFVRETR